MILSLKARSQEKGALYVFDENWKPTKIKTAKFLLHAHQVNDTCWQWDYYNFAGPLIKSEQFRDGEGKELNGISYNYNLAGFLDSTTTFRRGKKNGDAWKLSGDSLKFRFKYVYRDDSLIEFIDVAAQKKILPYHIKMKRSLNIRVERKVGIVTLLRISNIRIVQ